MSGNPQQRKGWSTINKAPANHVSFKELMLQEEEKKLDNELNEQYIENSLLEDDYAIALQLQQEFDRQGKEETTTISNDIDDDYALALQLQLEEERAAYCQQPKRQESTKIVFDHPYEYNYEPILNEPDVQVHEEVKIHHLGINSPYMGEDLGDGDDQLVRPASIYHKHDREHIGKVNISFHYSFLIFLHRQSARLQLSMNNKEDIEGYSMDDSSIVRMRKFYSHKKDRTLAAPKVNILTTNSTLDNNVRLLILNFINNGYIDSVGGNIQNGKEGIVISAVKYVDESTEEWYCLKIYKESTMEFKNKKMYIHGERRFDDVNTLASRSRVITEEWARKEFNNLNLLVDGLVPCPEPILCTKNVLLMKMIGEDGQAAPILKLYMSSNPQMAMSCFSQCVELLFSMFQKCNLIHADFSEYNLLVFKKKVFVIDVGQSVDTLHPMWEEFLKRDIHNILVFFNDYVNIPLLEEAEDSLYHAITEMSLSKEEFIQIFCNNP